MYNLFINLYIIKDISFLILTIIKTYFVNKLIKKEN